MVVSRQFHNQTHADIWLPRYLFRYLRDDENLETTITTPYLWFSAPSAFNDPFDCNNGYSLAFDFEDFAWWTKKFGKASQSVLAMYSAMNQTPGWFDDIKNTLMANVFKHWYQLKINQISVCCFSDISDNALMWSHYANGHRGVCVVFDTAEMIVGGRFSIIEVAYLNEIPKYNLIAERKEFGSSDLFNFRFDQLVLGTKTSEWAYEREHRLISHFHGHNQIPSTALVGVVFGAKMDNARARKLQSAWEANTAIQFYAAKIDATRQSILTSVPENKIDRFHVTEVKYLRDPLIVP